MVVGVVIFAATLVVVIIFVIANRNRSNNTVGGLPNNILKISYPSLSYKEVLKLGYENAEHLLKTIPCVRFNEIELLAFLCHVGRLSVMATNGNIREWGKESSEFIHSKISDDQRKKYINRYSFYLNVSGGEKVEGVWSYSKLPDSMLRVPMMRDYIAFGDCITNPDMIEDYYEGAISLNGITEQQQFYQRYTNDFFRFVHTFCVMVAGKEFDPPQLDLDEIET